MTDQNNIRDIAMSHLTSVMAQAVRSANNLIAALRKLQLMRPGCSTRSSKTNSLKWRNLQHRPTK